MENKYMSLYIGSCKYPTGEKWRHCKMCDRKYWCDDSTENPLSADDARKLTQKGMTELYKTTLYEITENIRTAALTGEDQIMYNRALIKSVQDELVDLGYQVCILSVSPGDERAIIRWNED
jgi:hypothetical protein